jgi:hypothetical protein
MDESGKDMVPAGQPPEPNGGMRVYDEDAVISSWDSQATAVRHSFALDSDEGKSMYMRALSDPDQSGVALAGQDIRVQDWLLHVVELTDQRSGECYKTLRLVLLTADGKVLSTCSPSMISGWAAVVKLYGSGTFAPPLTVRVKAVKAKVAGSYLKIDSVSREPARVKGATSRST